MNNREYQRMRQYEDEYWWYHGLRGLTTSMIARYCSAPRPRLLDAGCGTGGQMAWLRDRLPGVSLTGIDLAPEAVQSTRERGFADLARASVMRLPFAEGAFDVITSLDVLYFQGVDDEAALRDMRRALRPGGLLLLNLPAFEWLRGAHDAAVRTRHRYQSGEVRAKLTQAGFAIELISYWNMTLLPVVAAARWLSRLTPRSEATSDFRPLPVRVSSALKWLVSAEVNAMQRRPLPIGVSVFAVARKVGE